MPPNRIHPPRTIFRPATVAALLGGLLAACGGGGGGEPPVPASPLVITSRNAEAVTADALQATGTGVSASIAALLPAVLQLPMPMKGVEIDQTRLCIYGGRLYVNGSVASTDAMTVGDKITLTAQGCRMNPVYAVNGGLGFTVLAGGLTSDLAYPYSVTVQVDALNLSLDQSGYVQTLAGDTRVTAGAQSSTSASVVLSGASLRYSSTAYSYTLKDYQRSVLIVDGGMTGTTTATVITSNPMLGATVTYGVSTPAALVTDASGNLLAGTLKVVSGSTALLATVTAVNVFTVQVDTNGDGAYDQTQTATVAELQARR